MNIVILDLGLVMVLRMDVVSEWSVCGDVMHSMWRRWMGFLMMSNYWRSWCLGIMLVLILVWQIDLDVDSMWMWWHGQLVASSSVTMASACH